MELKEMILSTLAEIGEEPLPDHSKTADAPAAFEARPTPSSDDGESEASGGDAKEEIEFLEKLRERLLVLFEGLLSPNTRQIEAKIDLTLNFLEYTLATLDERIEKLKQP